MLITQIGSFVVCGCRLHKFFEFSTKMHVKFGLGAFRGVWCIRGSGASRGLVHQGVSPSLSSYRAGSAGRLHENEFRRLR